MPNWITDLLGVQTAAIDTRVFYIEPALTSRRADLQVVCTFMR